jgi:hypothetical protein
MRRVWEAAWNDDVTAQRSLHHLLPTTQKMPRVHYSTPRELKIQKNSTTTTDAKQQIMKPPQLSEYQLKVTS